MPSDAQERGLKIEPERRGPVMVVRLIGSADMHASEELGERLTELLEDDTEQMVLDLARLDFINSIGLGGIIAAHLRCTRQGATVKLVHPQPAIRDILAITKLTRLLPIHDSLDDAIASR